uniref:Uncharacterized protein n=1 Tax=Anguilla anguilla TaxID=7936 RepID=A0A0E9TBR0_ANGAN
MHVIQSFRCGTPINCNKGARGWEQTSSFIVAFTVSSSPENCLKNM